MPMSASGFAEHFVEAEFLGPETGCTHVGVWIRPGKAPF